MKKLLAFCLMLSIAFAVSAKPTSSTIKTYNLNTFKMEVFKHPVPPTITTYFFRYELEPTGTFGQWDVYLALYVKFSDNTESPANSPYTITVSMTSPITIASNFPAFTQNSWVNVINTGSSTEYTGDIAASYSPTNANGYPISPIIKHL